MPWTLQAAIYTCISQLHLGQSSQAMSKKGHCHLLQLLYVRLHTKLIAWVPQGTLPAHLETVLFQYFDVLSKLGAKEMSHSAAARLRQDVVVALSKMELEFPAWELDINRHMVLHLAESVPAQRPPWSSAMWSYERLWNRLTQWKSQNNQPEAVMINTYKAFKSACKIRGSLDVRTFDRPTDAILIPAYVHAHLTPGQVHVELSDAQPQQWLQWPRATREKATAEFHMYHLRSNVRYSELWEDYITTDVGRDPKKLKLKDMDKLLPGWLSWGQRAGLPVDDMALCRGPHPRLFLHDRATINGQQFVVSRLQQRSKFRNDVVMIATTGRDVEVGLVKSFIKVPAAGTAVNAPMSAGSLDLDQVAWVHWFGRSNASSPACLVCSKQVRSDNDNGNVWRITDLTPVNAAIVPRVLQNGELSTTEWQVLVQKPVVLA